MSETISEKLQRIMNLANNNLLSVEHYIKTLPEFTYQERSELLSLIRIVRRRPL